MSRNVWLAAAIGAVLLIIAGWFLSSSSFRPDGQALWASLWAIILGTSVVVVLAMAAGSWLEFLNYFLFALFGGALGWVTGILASPATADEERVFGEYKSAIVGFASGFMISKINDVWKLISTGERPLLFSQPVLNRLLLFGGMFLLLVAQQYNVRQSALGQMIISAAVDPPGARVDQTKGSVSVRPGAKVTLKGAAAYEDTDVDWSLKQDGTALAKAVALDGAVLTIPEKGDAKLNGVKSGSAISLVATSRFNKSKTSIMQVILTLDGAQVEVPKKEPPPQPEAAKKPAPVQKP